MTPVDPILLTDRVALVTGAAHGIGAAIARALSFRGAVVVLADLDGRAAEATAAAIVADGGRASAVALDVTDTAAVDAVLDDTAARFGRLDIMVNDAGIGGPAGPLHTLDLGAWGQVLDVNLTGTARGCAAALRHLTAGGAIVNVASAFGPSGVRNYPAYCTSKGAIVALTRQLAVDYGPSGIRVNAVCPGYVDNHMGGHETGRPSDAASAAREAGARVQPLGRQCSVDEIASAVAFLASDAASFVTGVALPVDGGMLAVINEGAA